MDDSRIIGGRKHFNPEDIEYLRLNRNVQYVSNASIRFTEEFKWRFYRQWKQQGKTARQLFRENGIDPDVLGDKRIEGFCYTLNKQAKSEQELTDGHKEIYHRPKRTGEESVETRLKQLEHELAYTRQEVEFLKKLQTANMEAKEQWESKHQPK